MMSQGTTRREWLVRCPLGALYIVTAGDEKTAARKAAEIVPSTPFTLYELPEYAPRYKAETDLVVTGVTSA